MAREQTINRTDSVRVKLAPEMLERVEKLAGDFGMPTATLCAFAVAAWVRQQEQNASLSRMAILDATRRMADQAGGMDLSDERMERLLAPMMAEFGKAAALSQVNLPLDGEAAGKAA